LDLVATARSAGSLHMLCCENAAKNGCGHWSL
jgi:hypothetical protein